MQCSKLAVNVEISEKIFNDIMTLMVPKSDFVKKLVAALI